MKTHSSGAESKIRKSKKSSSPRCGIKTHSRGAEVKILKTEFATGSPPEISDPGSGILTLAGKMKN